MKKTNISLVASFLLATNLYSQTTTLQSVKISANTIETDEKKATFATEVYTKKDIEQSNSKDIYDFLSSQTSVKVMPNMGNTFSQSLDMRGYGLENGNQNLVVIVNGRRLNNIDMAPQLLSSISIDSIEKIEIIKGSGSVRYGDGANSGVINIVTDKKNSNYIKTAFGDNFTKNGVVSLGYGNEYIIANAYIDYSSTNGSIEDLNEKTNENYIKNKNFSIIFTPIENLELNLVRTYSNMNLNYANPITLDQFKNNPNLSPNGFNEQYFSSYVTIAGIRYDFNSDFYIDANFSDEDKISNFITWSNSSKYEYKSFNSSINYKNDIFKTSLGVDGFKGKRIGNTNTTSKDNMAGFASFEINATDDLILSTGFRRENVKYEYNPQSGTNLKQDSYLNAYDFGINYTLDENQSVFANYNRSFQAPDIDRFFSRGGGFNEFIEPAKVDNYNIGYNNIQNNNKLKVSLFRANLKNEIYFYDSGDWMIPSYNTNIDKSYKYGLEVYDKYLINDKLFTSLNYSYIIAKIDEENKSNGAYNGKKLPGVSKHNLSLALGYSPAKNFETILSHSYRSSTYAIGDFKNNFYEKQKHYHSTDLSFNFKKKNVELFAKIQNLFDQKNGLWVANTWGSSDTVYPVNFERTFFAGMKVNF
ncbi:TonB-dependent receptor [Aliarcobacter skirrowii]|uniref:TonB-dependent receptor n=1 Tax=Aliarcobacter skirrowii TaxID=28200 RepID=UPI000D60818E|nr:TonB-dependent receptor [Aliarcobacter skirrowii]MDX4012556.1 TonB-dependent receptor [Aliarcobacter skirrowii]PWE19926.1 TonB-dependent receptor [Aliarcobacter skirrowii]PWE24966.1 TonB-dependent receptor [Aliarcobacter skirrowii]RJO55475.1 TonB-dependent receptor [Aliarcobacter skirrowii]RJO57430.1 TonB-dependent receptor [Aliarcobacter skirrowii]